MEATTPQYNSGVTYGLVSGMVTVVVTLVLYLGGVSWFMSPVTWIISFIIPIIFAILAVVQQKKNGGGYLEFREGLKVAFTSFVLNTLIGTVFIYILFNLIDIGFRDALNQEAATATAKFMEKMKASPDQIEKTTNEMLQGNNYSLSKIALNSAFGLIFWFLVSLIIALIFKRKKPEFPTLSI